MNNANIQRLIDIAMIDENKKQVKRNYLGASRWGNDAHENSHMSSTEQHQIRHLLETHFAFSMSVTMVKNEWPTI